MKRFRYLLLALALIFLAAFITKPSEKTCKAKTVALVKARMAKKYGRQPNEMMMKFIEMTAENGIIVSDKGLYRKISFRVGKLEKPIGWGAFGMVNTKENF
jgi:hypothetical protein